MFPAAPSRYLFNQGHTGRCPSAPRDNIRWWKERVQHCRSDTPTHPLFGWTKVIKVLAQAMRARGIRCLWFIDDCLLALPSRPLAILARKTVEDLFVRSGLTRAPDKGVWVPTQTLPDHLGVEISTVSDTGWIKVPHRRCQEISRSVKDILCRSATSESQTCFIGSSTIVPRQGIVHRGGM
jgi:hypothetical protein